MQLPPCPCRLLHIALTLAVGSWAAEVNSSSVDLADDSLIGQIIEMYDNEGGSLPVRIDRIDQDDSPGNDDVFLYTLSAFNVDEGAWQNVCTTDSKGQAHAIVMQGAWDAQGRYQSSSEISFGCSSGVLAKCIRWGYKPWLDSSDLPMRQLHQACTRLVRADYCGDGRPHTQDGTAINLFDVYGIQTRDVVDGMQFEAAWNEAGAIAINQGRYASGAEIVAECPSRLQPHTQGVKSTLSITELQALYPNALIFNESFAPRLSQ